MHQTLNSSAAEKFCKDCGSVINAKAEICPKCGVRQLPTTNSRNKLVAALLALFLGSLGIHKFYLGQKGWGIVYLLLCWTFIPGLVAFVEAVLLLMMSDEKFYAKFG